MLTNRDMEILEFVKLCNYTTTSLLAYKFFPSKHSCQVRLTKLVNAKHLKRVSLSSTMDSIYMLPKQKQTTQLQHLLYVCQTVPYFEALGKRVLNLQLEAKLSSKLRTDGILLLANKEVYLIECERCHTSLNPKLRKYEYYFNSEEFRKQFAKFTTKLLFITNNPVPRTALTNVEVLPLDFIGYFK